MTCAEIAVRLDAYVRGTLPAADAAALEAHLEHCDACTRLLETTEPAPSVAISRSLPPADDLWPAIQQRLRPRGARRRFAGRPAWQLAAAAVLLVAVSSGVTALLLRSVRPSAPVAVEPSVAPLEAQYAGAAAELRDALAAARQRLTPETVAVIERNLAVIDSALAESRRALARDPGNRSLERLVIATWQQKVDFLRRATSVPTKS